MLKLLLLASATLILADGQELKTDISLNNPTRIIFEDDRPTKLIFNESDQNAPSIAAELGTSGDIFITVERGASGQNIAGFVTTESGKTYPVRFNIRHMDPAQVTIASAELRRDAEKAKTVEVASAKKVPQVEWTQESSYTASLGELIKALYLHAAPEGFKEVKASKSQPIVADNFIAVPHKRYVASNIEAVTYKLQSTRDYSVHIPTHMEAFPKYLALSYSGEHIEPGKPVYVYMVRKTHVEDRS